MHIYQKQILDLLRAAPSLRYSQLQPDDVESSHFKYHLNQLIKEGLVEQISRGVYVLTVEGKVAVDRLSEGRVNPRLTPKVITYTLIEDNNNYYLYKKTKEPYRGLLNAIGGKVHVGESTEAAAKREVYEKTSKQIIDVQLKGIAEIRIHQTAKLLSHAITYIYSAQVSSDAFGSNMLVKIPKNELTNQPNLAPDLLHVINICSASSPNNLVSLDIDYAAN